MSAGPDPGALARYLDRLRLLLWAARSLAALERCAAVAAIAVGLNTLVAERSAAGPWTVFTLSLCGTAALLATVARLAPAFAVPSREDAARRVQAIEPGLRTDVESSLELGPGAAVDRAISVQLIGALVGSTSERLAVLPARAVVPWRGARAAAFLLAAGLLPLVALALTGGVPATAARALVDPRTYW
ncbi:MAG TPA: hypothetical protein VN317_08685, partial [Candidatus Methanoperedens sp.]|nr:hypothetical protein [Candidatus Methanoperedens sp.]